MNIGSTHALKGKFECESMSVVCCQFAPISCQTMEEVDKNVDTILDYMDKAAAGYPGLDLFVSAECALQGAGPGWQKLLISLDSPQIMRLKDKCAELGIWGIFNPWIDDLDGRKGCNTAIMVNDKGEIVHGLFLTYLWTISPLSSMMAVLQPFRPSRSSIHGLNMPHMPSSAHLSFSPQIMRLKDKCAELGIWGIFNPWIDDLDGRKGCNTAIMVNDKGEIVHKYVKNNPWTPGEITYPGDEIPVTEGPCGSRVGIIICADGDYPECWRQCAVNGANVIVRISHYMSPWDNAWEITNKAGAYCNQVYVCTANSVGVDECYTYFGRSMILNPDGTILTEAPQGRSVDDKSRHLSGHYRSPAQESRFTQFPLFVQSPGFEPLRNRRKRPGS